MTLVVDGVDVRYDDRLALAGVDLEIGDGERLAVLGPSGSGKSTLLRAIAGLEPLASGRIALDGRDLAGVPPHRRGFGVMFQDYALFPHRDVGRNVEFGLEMQGIPADTRAARAREVLQLVGLGGYERRAVTTLSGGEQQRVALARALAPTPRLLMLDEPLGALDRALRRRLLDELIGLFADLRLAIVYVTHDQEEALAVGDRVALLRGGRLETVLPPALLWHSPPSEFAARFLGFNNIAPLRATADGRATTPWGEVALPAGRPATATKLLIRPNALELDPGGPIAGIVHAASFRGDHTSVIIRSPTTVGADAGPVLEAHLPAIELPATGQRIRLRARPDGIRYLP